jgi:hypothetical protein
VPKNPNGTFRLAASAEGVAAAAATKATSEISVARRPKRTIGEGT